MERPLNHWDGAAWTNVGPGYSTGNPSLYRVWASSPSNIYAVGDYKEVLHYDGSAWSQLNVGSGNPRALEGVWGSSASDVFVAGGGDLPGYGPAVIYHFDGTSWQAMQVPAAVGSMFLGDMWGTGPHDVYVSAWTYALAKGLLLHYDGTSWSVVLSEPYWLGQTGGTGPNDVTLVGGGGHIWHFNGATWSEIASPTTQDLYTVYFTQDGTGWIGGVDGSLLRRAP